jgi:acetyltransferase-like isoleucine patch superfamily enzyme
VADGNVKTLEVRGLSNQVEIDESAKVQLPIRIEGDYNRLVIGKNVRLTGISLDIFGSHCSVVFHDHAMMHGHLRCKHDHAHVSYGRKTTAMNIKIHLHEAGSITIGEDCMISGNVSMNVSDVHSIMDRATGKRINMAKDIVIGDHVWLAQDVIVAKGCQIGSGSIVGAKSFVRGMIPENVLVAGVPARLIRENVEWDRARL